MDNNRASFTELDLGSAKPTSVKMEEIIVTISGDLFGQYARAFVKEAYRKNPLRAEQVNLQEAEVEKYCYYLLSKRVECVQGNCTDFRKLKVLYVPAWIQHNMAMIGRVILRDQGLTLVPEMAEKSDMTYTEAVAVSEKIGMFVDDLQIVQDAMPRTENGDTDVMSTALIADYVRSLKAVTHVASTYVTAFLGMRLKEEIAMSALYRIQYDDIEFIATALTTHRGLY